MGFNHNNQQFADEDSYQFAYKHLRQMDCGGQITSFSEFSSCRGNPGIYPYPEGEKEGIFSQFRGKVRCEGDPIVPNSSTPRQSDLDYGSSRLTSNSEVMRSLPSKRLFGEDMLDKFVFKRVRQGEHIQDSSVPTSGTCDRRPNSVNTEELENRIATLSEDPTKVVPRNFSNLPWYTTLSVEDARSESPVRLSFFPGYFEDNRRTPRFNRPEEQMCAHEFDYSSQKLVSVGPNHQAELPILRFKGLKNYDGESDSLTYSTLSGHPFVEDDDSDKWLGNCIMSMPDSDEGVEVSAGKNKIDCSCVDKGSVRCMRQHVNEARERLKERLGKDRFSDLGFYDMGETVAKNWTEEEEELFHEVVASNPASLGKNFWDYLSLAFPSRSSKELVSYYFNVFMLRKRAEQNRAVPLVVDSDNDEWEESDDDHPPTSEDYDDSAVESPVDRDEVTCNNFDLAGVHIHDEAEVGGVPSHSTPDTNEELHGVSKFNPMIQPVGGTEDHNVQDDSCTSFEEQHNKTFLRDGSSDLAEMQNNLEQQEYRSNGLSGLTNQEYLVGHCAPDQWEMNYLNEMGKDVDFLPTCNVIEEFGDASCDI